MSYTSIVDNLYMHTVERAAYSIKLVNTYQHLFFFMGQVILWNRP